MLTQTHVIMLTQTDVIILTQTHVIMLTQTHVIMLTQTHVIILTQTHVIVLQVDCTANPDTCKDFGASAYPLLKVFRNGVDAGSYTGPRTAGMHVENTGLNVVRHVRDWVWTGYMTGYMTGYITGYMTGYITGYITGYM